MWAAPSAARRLGVWGSVLRTPGHPLCGLYGTRCAWDSGSFMGCWWGFEAGVLFELGDAGFVVVELVGVGVEGCGFSDEGGGGHASGFGDVLESGPGVVGEGDGAASHVPWFWRVLVRLSRGFVPLRCF